MVKSSTSWVMGEVTAPVIIYKKLQNLVNIINTCHISMIKPNIKMIHYKMNIRLMSCTKSLNKLLAMTFVN